MVKIYLCLFVVLVLIQNSKQAGELSVSVNYKSTDTETDEVNSVLFNLLPNHNGSSTNYSSCGKCSRMERIFARNRILLCGSGVQHNWMVKDEQLSSSTWHANDDKFSPRQGRLFNSASSGGYWRAGVAAAGQWIEVDLLEDVTIYGVVTQGRSIGNEYVSSYNVLYQTDGSATLETVMEDDGQPMIFQGNRDNYSPVINNFPHPITARVFRIRELTYYVHPSLRFDLLIC